MDECKPLPPYTHVLLMRLERPNLPASSQGLTLVHFLAQLKAVNDAKYNLKPHDNLRHPLITP